MQLRDDPRYPRTCEYVKDANGLGKDCSKHGYAWKKKVRCKPCFWLTFPPESWSIFRLWNMCHESWETQEGGKKFGFSDARFQSLVMVDHPAFEDFEKFEAFELLLEMTGHANGNQPDPDPETWQTTEM